ncbi:MAG: bifunctional phosphoribosyl-AMP cyclohydrolase/phosphoribosyl-ATP diphosphatase HisIE [Chitinophagaceae bacterium]|nr:bifunctional phosphoribosyl-AMP cyclohydrolase/phosphoribosyl-ATP diphosphatase HisIE [Chitinophagaceae bacterium]
MQIDFKKHPDGLVPAIVQDDVTLKVLMMGYMNEESLQQTLRSGFVTFYSRSRQRLWTKGEESGNLLDLKSLSVDCDGDTILVKVHPRGPVCHTGADTCWNEVNHSGDFLTYLEEIIELRKRSDDEQSYVRSLFGKGQAKIAQKVGEEAVELVIESMRHEPDLFVNEAADLLFHYLILLNSKGYKLQDIREILKQRHSK